MCVLRGVHKEHQVPKQRKIPGRAREFRALIEFETLLHGCEEKFSTQAVPDGDRH
jgi:hypothetical protein